VRKITIGLALTLTLGQILPVQAAVPKFDLSRLVPTSRASAERIAQDSSFIQQNPPLDAIGRNLLERSHQSISRITKPQQQAEMLIRLANTYSLYSQETQAQETLAEAFSIAQGLTDLSAKGALLDSITAAQVRLGQKDEAERSLQALTLVANALPDPSQKGVVFQNTVLAYAEAGDLEQATRLTRLLPEGNMRKAEEDFVINLYTSYLAEQNRYEEAIALLQNTSFMTFDYNTGELILSPSPQQLLQSRIQYLYNLLGSTNAESAPKFKATPATYLILKTAQQWITQLTPTQKLEAQGALLLYLSVVELPEEELNLLDQLRRGVADSALPLSDRIEILEIPVIHYMGINSSHPTVQKSLQLLQNLLASYGTTDDEKNDKVASLRALAQGVRESRPDLSSGFIQQAVAVVGAGSLQLNNEEHIFQLLKVAEDLITLNRQAEAWTLVQKVLPVASQLTPNNLVPLINVLFALGKDVEAEKISQSKIDDLGVLTLTLHRLTEQKKFDKALELIRTIADPDNRMWAWSQIATSQAANRQRAQSLETMKQAIAFAQNLPDQPHRMIAQAIATYGSHPEVPGEDFISLVNSLNNQELQATAIDSQLAEVTFHDISAMAIAPSLERLQALIPQLPPESRDEQWSRLAVFYGFKGQPEQVLNAIAQIQSTVAQAETALSILERQALDSEVSNDK
jgi:hypothetical protein